MKHLTEALKVRAELRKLRDDPSARRLSADAAISAACARAEMNAGDAGELTETAETCARGTLHRMVQMIREWGAAENPRYGHCLTDEEMAACAARGIDASCLYALAVIKASEEHPGSFGTATDLATQRRLVDEAETELARLVDKMAEAVGGSDLVLDADGASFRRWPSIRLAAGWPEKVLNAAATEAAKAA